MLEVNEKFKKQGGFKSISFADEGPNSPLSLENNINMVAVSNPKMMKKLSKTEMKDYLSRINQDAENPSVLDSPTYLTLDAFLYQLSDIGIRPEFFVYNKSGEITGTKGGAIKPKGINVNVTDAGDISVYYNKTALFYNPTIESKVMNTLGVDVLSFASGNKVNKVTKRGKIVDGYKQLTGFEKDNENITLDKLRQDRADRREPEINSIVDILQDIAIGERNLIRGGKGKPNVQLIPLETFVNHSLKKPAKGSVGVNTGLHLKGDKNINEWMGTKENLDAFESNILAMQKSRYTAADIVNQLLNNKGNINVNSPLEAILANDGLLLSPYLGEQSVNNLFSYFYKGGKVGNGEVGNSSYNVMGVNVEGKFSTMDLPVTVGGTQRNYGVERQDITLMNQGFKWRGEKTKEAQELVSTTMLTFESDFLAPGYNPKEYSNNGGKYIADVAFFEGSQGKLIVRADGYTILPDGTAIASKDVMSSMKWKIRKK